MDKDTLLDLVGIGLGPAQLSLAIALAEDPDERLSARFLERKPQFDWHPGFQHDYSSIQMSHLKDLVTLRNPMSRFTFINYLHVKRRLEKVANTASYRPSRQEYEDYLKWVIDELNLDATFDANVTRVEPVVDGGTVRAVRVGYQGPDGRTEEVVAGHLSVATGKSPHIPAPFGPETDRVFHVRSLCDFVESLKGGLLATKVAIVGAGQSGAEAALVLLALDRSLEVTVISRGHVFKAIDANPFVNGLYTWDHAMRLRRGNASWRKGLIDDLKNTNYGVVDGQLLDELFQLAYKDSVAGLQRLSCWGYTDIRNCRSEASKASLQLFSLENQELLEVEYDYVILATGFVENQIDTLLAPLSPWLPKSSAGGKFLPTGEMALQTAEAFLPKILVHGYFGEEGGFCDGTITSLAGKAATFTELLKNIPSEVLQ